MEVPARSKLAKYEQVIAHLCNFPHLGAVNDETDIQGCLGIAMVMAFVDGVHPSLSEFSAHLKIPIIKLKEPFERLRINGIFRPKYNARKDKDLKGDNTNFNNDYINREHWTEICWGIIAGVSQGYVGVK